MPKRPRPVNRKALHPISLNQTGFCASKVKYLPCLREAGFNTCNILSYPILAWDAALQNRAAADAARPGSVGAAYAAFAPAPADRVREPGFLDAMPYYFRHTSRFEREHAHCIAWLLLPSATAHLPAAPAGPRKLASTLSAPRPLVAAPPHAAPARLPLPLPSPTTVGPPTQAPATFAFRSSASLGQHAAPHAAQPRHARRGGAAV
jgi:hypothetical protein